MSRAGGLKGQRGWGLVAKSKARRPRIVPYIWSPFWVSHRKSKIYLVWEHQNKRGFNATTSSPGVCFRSSFTHTASLPFTQVQRHCLRIFCRMSRGGRGGGRGGFGGSSRGGFGPSNLPPMGLTFADIQNMSREASELYPVRGRRLYRILFL